MALEQIVIKDSELAAAKSIYSTKLDNPLLNFHEKMKKRDNGSSGMLSLDTNISVDAIETFFGAYGIVRQKLSGLSAVSIGGYEQVINLYALYVAASHAHNVISKNIENELPYAKFSTIQNIDDEYLLINDLASKYLTAVERCRTSKDIARMTKGYFARVKGIASSSLSSGRNASMLQDLQKNVEIQFEDSWRYNTAQSKKKRKKKGVEKVSFDDLGGNHAVKQEMQYLIKSFKHPDRRKYGYKPPRGIFFYGHPGTGKTLAAKALAHECKMPFHYIALSDVLSKWQGESEQNLAEALTQPGIKFIDEYDSLGKIHNDTNGTSTKLVNVIAEAMDGYDSDPDGLFIASANTLTIERKLKRAGRFDKFIFFGAPDCNDIKEILYIHLKKLQDSAEIKLFNGVDVNQVATVLYRKSQQEQKQAGLAIVGADIAEIVRRVHESRWRQYVDSRSFSKIGTEDFRRAINAYSMEERA